MISKCKSWYQASGQMWPTSLSMTSVNFQAIFFKSKGCFQGYAGLIWNQQLRKLKKNGLVFQKSWGLFRILLFSGSISREIFVCRSCRVHANPVQANDPCKADSDKGDCHISVFWRQRWWINLQHNLINCFSQIPGNMEQPSKSVSSDSVQ